MTNAELERSNLPFLADKCICVFFSYPFYPNSKVYRKTYKLYGHLSLSIGKNVYQIHNPKKLRAKFLVSKMPIIDWLYSDGDWLDDDQNSKTFRHVHLYKKAELKRTNVFYFGKTNISQRTIQKYESELHDLEKAYQNNEINFFLLKENCSRFVRSVAYRENWLKPMPIDFLPATFFWRLNRIRAKNNIRGVLAQKPNKKFLPHKFCLGIISLNPLRYLRKIVAQDTLP